jgi:ParB family chromosome partitioning protein
MVYDLSAVALEGIDTADQTFRITTDRPTRDLSLSIETVGLLQPCVLTPAGSGHRVVCGFRRIAACRDLNLTTILARILPPDLSPLACARIAISDNAYQRPLNLVEQSRAYALIQQCAAPSESAAWPTIARACGLADSPSAMAHLLPVAEMSTELQAAILSGDIALPIARRIDRLSRRDATSLCHFYLQITTSLNKQRELWDLITDISARDGISIADLLAQEAIAALVDDRDCPTPQKVQRLRGLLKSRRYPTLAKAEADFQRNLKSLNLNAHIQLQPPPFFEGKSYRLALVVEGRAALSRLLTELEKVIDHPGLLPE